MVLTQSLYRKILLLALTMLLALPCSVKKELQEWLHIETTQHAKPVTSRTICSSFIQQEKQNTQLQSDKVFLPNTTIDAGYIPATSINKSSLSDFYNKQKEKIPSYILFERFLI